MKHEIDVRHNFCLTSIFYSRRNEDEMTCEPLLSINNISKEFPGVKALTDVSFDVYPGEIHVLIGENGAGK